jgi:hypothetical protein
MGRTEKSLEELYTERDRISTLAIALNAAFAVVVALVGLFYAIARWL